MSPLERYRELYEYEKDCNQKMLAMLQSVLDANRADPRFSQAMTLAGHLAACRENWLARMDGGCLPLADWFPAREDLDALPARYDALHARWTDYLARLDDAGLAQDFTFIAWDGSRFALPIEVQIIELNGHALYHRGQISLLTDQLGGETVDTDYVFWAVPASIDT